MHHRKILLFTLLLSAPARLLLAETPATDSPLTSAKIANPPDASKQLVFSLLPTSLQKNPHTDMTTICEMTDEGRKRPVVTRETPATYIAHDAGFAEAGDTETLIQPDREVLRQNLERALSHNGFKPAEEGKPADYALIFHWGTHTKFKSVDTLGDVYNRAMLVGGKKFAKEFAAVLIEEAKDSSGNELQEGEDGNTELRRTSESDRALQKAVSRSAFSQDELGGSQGTTSIAGNATAMMKSLSPMQRFMRESDRNRFLVEQSMSSIYFVVISAYDPVSLAKGKKSLLWRARMSIDSQGLSLVDALPAMVSHGAPFLGRDMDEVATMVPKLMRSKAEVNIGEATVVEDPKRNAK